MFQLIDGVFSDALLPGIDDERKAKVNPLNANFEKKEFQELWSRINRKAAYTVEFETPELVGKCVAALEKELKVSPLQYTIQRGEQTASASYEELQNGQVFELQETETGALAASIQSAVKYDLIGKLAEQTKLTRRTIGCILQGINVAVFSQYRMNPEDFMLKAVRLINEQKATVIVEHLAYNPVEDSHSLDIFTQEKPKEDFSKAVKTGRHIYDYVFTDSANERTFVRELDTGTDVVVYAKLPRTFFIPTPVGRLQPRLGDRISGGRGEAHIFHRRNQGVAVFHGSQKDRGMQDRMRPQVLQQDHVRPGQVRRGGQLREADGVGEIG